MQMEISSEESDLLAEVISTYMINLRSEIHHTENPAYKKELKEQEALLQCLSDKLQKVKSSAMLA